MVQCVYKISCVDENIKQFYIGSCVNLSNRCSIHKDEYISFPNRKVYKFIRDNGGMSNWDIIPIEIFKFLTKDELRLYEQYYIDTYKPDLNCINAIQTKEQRRDYVKKFNKEYKDKNRAHINSQRRARIGNCPHCNKEFRRDSIKRHIRQACKSIST